MRRLDLPERWRVRLPARSPHSCRCRQTVLSWPCVEAVYPITRSPWQATAMSNLLCHRVCCSRQPRCASRSNLLRVLKTPDRDEEDSEKQAASRNGNRNTPPGCGSSGKRTKISIPRKGKKTIHRPDWSRIRSFVTRMKNVSFPTPRCGSGLSRAARPRFRKSKATTTAGVRCGPSALRRSPRIC